jgi:hypothetical protein
MYQLNMYDMRKAKHRVLRFNSIDAAVRFVKETLNQKDIQTYIAHLRNNRELNKNVISRSYRSAYTYYGDLDLPIPTVKSIEDDILTEGKFEYRIGSSDPTLHETFGCIYFKLVDEYKPHTSVRIPQEVQQTKPTVISNPINVWLAKPSFLS